MKRIVFNATLLFLVIFIANPLLAVNKPVKEATATASSLKKEMTAKELKKLEKIEKKLEKRMDKLKKKANGADVDFDDPVDKWMWFWIFGWGAGFVFALLSLGFGFFGFLSGACMLFGTVALVLWLVKKFS